MHIKNQGDLMNIWNCHAHSEFSHDGTGSIEQICNNSVTAGLNGIAITDHCDCEFYNDKKMIDKINTGFNTVENTKVLYKDKIELINGIEIGEALFNPKFADSIINSNDWDMVLGSVHAVRIRHIDMPFSTIDFSAFDEKEIINYVSRYFDDLHEMVISCDYDVVSHLTVILRYVKYKYKRNLDKNYYFEKIEDILKSIIRLDKTLEINTSGFSDGYLMPDIELLELYSKLGGKKFTIGNDSHSPLTIADNLSDTVAVLKNIGINRLAYFRNRKAYFYNI